MIEDSNSRKFSFLLLQEALWGIEDKIKIVVETLADYEIELLTVKRQLKEILTQLNHGQTQNE